MTYLRVFHRLLALWWFLTIALAFNDATPSVQNTKRTSTAIRTLTTIKMPIPKITSLEKIKERHNFREAIALQMKREAVITISRRCANWRIKWSHYHAQSHPEKSAGSIRSLRAHLL